MKRTDLLRHLEKAGCELLREGARHSVYVNRNAKKSSAQGIGRLTISWPVRFVWISK